MSREVVNLQLGRKSGHFAKSQYLPSRTPQWLKNMPQGVSGDAEYDGDIQISVTQL